MLFDRYKEITNRCLELGEKMDHLTRKEGEELRQLLDEQAWLSKTITRHVKDVLEEVKEGLEFIKSWVDEGLEKVEKASGDKGVPSDILDLEEVMDEAVDMRDRARDLMLDRKSGEEINAVDNLHDAGESPRPAEIRIDLSGEEDGAESSVAGEEPVSRRKINTGRGEVAVTMQEPACAEFLTGNAGPGNFNLKRDGNEVKKTKNKGKVKNTEQEKLPQTGAQVVQPAAINLSPGKIINRDVVAEIEKKLSPEFSAVPEPGREEEKSPLQGNGKNSRRSRGKKSKKKKK